MVISIDKRRLMRSAFHTVVILLAIFGYFAWLRKAVAVDTISFNKGWTISFEDEKYTDQDVTTYRHKGFVKRGDVFVLGNRIPEAASGKYTIEFLTYLSKIKMEVGGREVSSYGESLYNAKKMLGSGYYRVRLPDDAAGKDIRITITAGENNAFSRLYDIRLIESRGVITNFAVSNALTFFISVFLVVMGIVLPMFGILFFIMKRDYERIVVIGLLSLSMGLWTMCNTKMIQIFSSDLAWSSLVEYISLYLAPIPLIRIIDILYRDKGEYSPKWKDYVIYGSSGSLIVFFVVAIVLHMTNVLHISQLLPVFQLLGLVSVISVLIVTHRPYGSLTNANKLMWIAIIVMVVTAVLDFIRFNFREYLISGSSYLFDTSFLPIGTFVFNLLLLIGYIIYLYEHYISQAEKKALQERAFTDTLTGLYNRAFFEKEVDELCQHMEEYGIISMDLNGLKHVNDTMGHAKGDMLLNTFSEILRESFKGVGDIIRMGGDEFLILIRNPSPREIARCLINMDKLEREKSSEAPFEIRTAYGEAYSSECKGHDKEAVYRLADSRMYDMKKRSRLKL